MGWRLQVIRHHGQTSKTTMLVDGGIYCQFSDYPKLDGLSNTTSNTEQSGDQNRGAADSDYNIT